MADQASVGKSPGQIILEAIIECGGGGTNHDAYAMLNTKPITVIASRIAEQLDQLGYMIVPKVS